MFVDLYEMSMKATSLFMCMLCFQIYPSEYGLQRMKEEDEKGPPELTQGMKKKGKTGDEEGECSTVLLSVFVSKY